MQKQAIKIDICDEYVGSGFQITESRIKLICQMTTAQRNIYKIEAASRKRIKAMITPKAKGLWKSESKISSIWETRSSKTQRWVLETTTSLCMKKNGWKLSVYSQHMMEKLKYLKISRTKTMPCNRYKDGITSILLNFNHTLLWNRVCSKEKIWI